MDVAKDILAMYFRISKEDLDLSAGSESNSITNQRLLIRDYYHAHSDLHKYEPVEFVDDGFSGTSFARPQFEAMLQSIRAGEIGCVIVKDLSRFGRNYLEVGNYLDMILPLYGIRFISVTDNFDTEQFKGSTGGMDVALRNLINGLYSADLSKKVRSAMRTRNRRGEYGGASPLYGYQLDPQNRKHLIVDENVRHVVEMIFEDCLSGMTQRQIARKLNTLGIPSPLEYKRPSGQVYNGRTTEEKSVWIQAVIKRILNDERYTGKMVSYTRVAERIGSNRTVPVPREDWIIVPNTHEAIIPEEVFQQVQLALSSRRRGGNNSVGSYKRSSIFVCGYCGRRLQRRSGMSDNHLRCPKADTVLDAPCKNVNFSVSSLEAAVLEPLRMICQIRTPSTVSIGSDSDVSLERIRNDRKRASDAIARIAARKTDLYEKYRSGKITKDGYIRIQIEEAEKRKESEAILSRCDKEEQRIVAEKAMQKAGDCGPDRFKTYDANTICEFVSEVRVFDENRIQLHLTFGDWCHSEI